jgi:tRNA-modifying protein YgfZ
MKQEWYQALAARGARIEAGRLAAFGEPAREERTAMAGPTLTALLSEGLLLASGEDAQAFLQGQLSNDVAQVSPSQSQLAAYCTPKGRVLAIMLLWAKDGAYVLQFASELVQPLAKRLQMYVLRSRVRLADLSGDLVLLGLAGPRAAEVVESEFGFALSAPYQTTTTSRSVTAIALPGDRVQLAVPVEGAVEVWDRLAQRCTPAGQASWDRHAIASGVPSITAATQDQFVPQMLNLELLGAVNFGKGCYPGQEIVARSQYRGQVKRRLRRFRASEEAVPGQAVYAADHQVGVVVNSAPEPGGGFQLLAVVQTQSSEGALSLSAGGLALRPEPVPYLVADAPERRTGDA